METVLKRVLTAITVMAVALLPAGRAYAEPASSDAQAEAGVEPVSATQPAPIDPGAATEGMTFEEARQAAYDILPETNSLDGWPQGPQVYGNAAIVMDINSGAVVYGKRINDPHYPASITKLLTALVALENASLDDEVLFSQESIDILRSDYASIGMRPGEIISLNDAMYGMLLASGNEVAYAIAENVGTQMGGGYDTFIQEMNDRSAELGCTGSNWVNANGLHDELHYTTAHDMALISAELYKHEEFRTITQTLNYTIGPTNLVNESRTFQQNHKMLRPQHEKYYEYCTGGKTGYTDDSRTTLVTMADNGTLQLVAVLLRDDGNVYDDTRAMMEYVFNNFSKVPLKDQPKPEEVREYSGDEAYVLLPEGIGFSSLDHEITISDERTAAGRITFYYEGQNVGSADVILTPEYVEETTGYTTHLEISDPAGGTAAGETESESSLPLPVRIAIGAAAAIAVAFILMLVLRYRMIKRRRRAAIRRRRQRARMRHHRR